MIILRFDDIHLITVIDEHVVSVVMFGIVSLAVCDRDRGFVSLPDLEYFTTDLTRKILAVIPLSMIFILAGLILMQPCLNIFQRWRA